VEAAMQIVVQHGVEALSMREIAERIEYSPSGLYEYFSSKEEIIDALVDEGFARLTTRLQQAIAAEAAFARLQQVGHAYLHFAVQEPQLYLMMFNRKPTDPCALADIEQNTAYAELLTIFENGFHTGEFHSPTGSGWKEEAYTCWSMLHGLSMLRLTLMNKVTDDIDLLHEKAFHLFVAHLR
jgi:AcrR family transcriptional regulator